MAEINTPKSDNLETMSMNKNKKNFMLLNKLRLQKLSEENSIRKRDLSPRHSTPKCPQPLKFARRENIANEINVKRTSTSSAVRILAGEEKKTNMVPKSAKEITKNARGVFKKSQNQTSSVEKKNQSVQALNTANEAFMKNAKVLEPSAHILAEIRQNKKTEVSKPKFVPSKRVFESHEEKEENHLDDLKEYLETGSISRRRKNFEQRRAELERKLGRYGKMTGSYSDSPKKFKSRSFKKHDTKSSLATKMNDTENYQNKAYLVTEVRDSRKRKKNPRKHMLMYQRKLFA